MATYVISDIHGEYEKFIQLLKIISFTNKDTLYILGDFIDRGKHPIKVIQEMMKHPNIIPILGNHEFMALTCLPFLNDEMEVDPMTKYDIKLMMAFINWKLNGSDTTLNEMRSLDKQTRTQVLRYLCSCVAYQQFNLCNKQYILVHGGLENFNPNKKLNEYSLYDLVWNRPDYSKIYYQDKYLVTGHTPTQLIKGAQPGKIYKKNNHIAIDCGATYGGRLAAYCFETNKEFYSD